MFDPTARTLQSPPKSLTTENFELAEGIIRALSGQSSLQQVFIGLFQATEKEILRLIRHWQLNLVVEDEQINDTVTDFIEDLSGSADEQPFLAKLLAIILRRPADMLQQIQFYSSRRLFTLLKKNASKRSHEYLSFNNLIKKNLGALADEGQINKLAANYWTAGPPQHSIAADTGFLSPAVLAQVPLKRTISNNGRNISQQVKQSLVLLLTHPDHFCYKFKTASISTALFNLDNMPTSIFSYQNDPTEHAENDQQATQTCEINAMAGCMLEQISLQLPDSDKMQVLIAGLAYCFIACPDYFVCGDFTDQHQAILNSEKGEIDRIHEFLNTEAFSDLFIKKPGRSTVFNRIRSFKTLLESSLIDFPVEVQQTGIKSLVNLLVSQYRQVTGRAK